jgi:hypothetical protein
MYQDLTRRTTKFESKTARTDFTTFEEDAYTYWLICIQDKKRNSSLAKYENS